MGKTEVDVEPQDSDTEKMPVPPPEPGSFALLAGIVTQNLKTAPRWLAKNAVWVAPLGVVWAVFHAIPDMTRMRLPGPLSALTSLVIFLTGTYNGIAGKTLYIVSANSVLVPLVREMKAKGGFAAVRSRLDRYSRAIGSVRRSYAALGAGALRMLLITGGTGFMLANLLSRNNKADKYLVSVLAALTLVNALSRGIGDPIVKLFRAAWRDIRKLAGRPLDGGLPVGHIFGAMAGVAAGLAGSLAFQVIRFTNSFYDPTGYIIGGACVAGGIIWSMSGGTHGKRDSK